MGFDQTSFDVAVRAGGIASQANKATEAVAAALVRHLRVDHGMSMWRIAKRLDIPGKVVKRYVEEMEEK